MLRHRKLSAAFDAVAAAMRSARQIARPGAALATLASAVALAGAVMAQSPPAAQPAPQSPPGEVDGKLQGEIANLAASGFEPIGGDTSVAVGRTDPYVFPVELESGITYAVVAACAGGCSHVRIALYDPAQKLVTRSPEKSDVVIVSGAAQQSGVHGIALSVPGCRQALCPAGFALLRKARPVAPDEAATAPAPSGIAPPATAPESPQLLAELAKLAVTAREAARARERRATPVVAPLVTDPRSAPGRPSSSSPAKPGAGAERTPRAAGQGSASQASCQQVSQQYQAAAQTAGPPGTMPELFRLYQYLQCNCGYPPSPQVPPCPR